MAWLAIESQLARATRPTLTVRLSDSEPFDGHLVRGDVKGSPDPSKFDDPVDVGVSAGTLNKRTVVREPKVDPAVASV